MRETAGILSLLLYPGKTRPDKVYNFLSTHNNLAENSLYLNLGYWKDATTYDGAAQALANLLGEAAGLCDTDAVLDVGCGFCDQDLYWAERFRTKQIIGLNITEHQIHIAKQRIERAGMSDCIEVRFGSATAIPLPDASVNKVVALESAFHFNTREIFFREAMRVLKPGGKLALADIAGYRQTANGDKLSEKIGKILWQMPDENMYTADVFRKKLEATGFENVHVESIRDLVFAPFRNFARKRIQDPEILHRLNPLLKIAWSADHRDDSAEDHAPSMDYLLVTAEKA
jgi:cyclopropane fatty-acyl-phospholipid synthase-like methyltransferase